MDHAADKATPYETPALRVLGSVEELTQCAKVWGKSDGNTFAGGDIMCRGSA